MARTGGFSTEQVQELKQGIAKVETALAGMAKERDEKLIPVIEQAVQMQTSAVFKEEMKHFKQDLLGELDTKIRSSMKIALEEFNIEQVGEEGRPVLL